MKLIPTVALSTLALLAACQEQEKKSAAPPSPNAKFEALKFTDTAQDDAAFLPPANLGLEITLARLGFSSGAIDGKQTRFDEQALRGFQEANGLPETGELDDATKTALAKVAPLRPTRMVRIPKAFASGPFVPDLPDETSKQGKFDHLGYRGLLEALAERFHTTPEFLIELNGPDAKIGPGASIRVPNVADVDISQLDEDVRNWNRTLMLLGVAPQQPSAAKVVVDKSEGTLRAYDGAGRLLVQFPATTGSEHDPLPIGEWEILGLSKNPEYHFNPELFWDVSDSEPDQMLKPGPNGPVGVVWIDLSKPHYGIHGTPEPASIGVSQSHGCVRLTNWDAARLAQMVKPGVQVIFQM